MRNITFYLSFFLILFLMPLAALAVTISQNVTLVLPSDPSTYTLLSGGTFDSLTINNSTFSFVMSASQSITLRSSGKRNLAGNSLGASTDCQDTYSEVILTLGSSASSQTVAVTPAGGCTSGTTSTSSGGGSTGGGGSPYFITQVTPPPPPAPLPIAPAPILVPAPALVLVPAPTPPPPAPVVKLAIFSDLVLGSEGNEVTRLQELLAKDKEIYPEGNVSGYFGRLTEAAVRRFQKKYGLPQVGRVGPQTRQKLSVVFGSVSAPVALPAPAVLPAPAPLPGKFKFMGSLSLGMKGNDVVQLQLFLAQDKALYPEGVVSGYFGQLTQRAVERFQVKYNIAKAGDAGYGFIGLKTRAKLNELLGN